MGKLPNRRNRAQNAKAKDNDLKNTTAFFFRADKQSVGRLMDLRFEGGQWRAAGNFRERDGGC